jgi:hypothetical protein
MNISVNCPSYKRPKVETLDYLPFVKVWIDEAEYDDYVKANEGATIISYVKGIQGNVCRIKNHILRTECENGNDVVIIMDDDMSGIGRYVHQGTYGYVNKKLKADEFMDFVVKYSMIAEDIGANYWGLNCNPDRQSYKQSLPYNIKTFIGSPFVGFLKGNECYYDENLPLKEDYDMTIQQLNKYRVVLRVNYYHYYVKQGKQSGGCATYRNHNREMEQLELLQKKWGSDIVKVDTGDRSHKAQKTRIKTDYNPVIRVPIKGV